MSEHGLILVALVMYAGAFVYALFLLQGRPLWGSWGHRTLITAGWLFHTYGLYLRASEIQRCPITNPFETMMFITWALVLCYLVLGMTWRVSFLGPFTLPLVIALCLFGLFPGLDRGRSVELQRSVWLSLHATLSLLAYGVWGLAAATGTMYLLQERQLKTHRLRSLFLRLPAIEQLDRMNVRLLLVGLALLAVGMVFGFVVGVEFLKKDVPKTLWTFMVWAVYGALLVSHRMHRWHGRKIALGSIALFLSLLATFGVVNMFSTVHKF
ncbi:MAG: cytochrome c biogenesis protein CcsA [Verrucomicrobia bacterium]|nr:cytochrome c biogenesis protein CcsA [Verrucomicrobiota bacterium]